LEIAKVNNQMQKDPAYSREKRRAFSDTSINICTKIISIKKGHYLEEDEDGNSEKINSLKNTAHLILADLYSTIDTNKCNDHLEKALNGLTSEDNTTKADIFNHAANIKLSQLKIEKEGGNKCELTKKYADEAKSCIEKAIEIKDKEGNFYDTYAEVLLISGDTTNFYKQLTMALRFPNIPKNITSTGYQDDKRWADIKYEKRFKDILSSTK
jgi:hypothetical protein